MTLTFGADMKTSILLTTLISAVLLFAAPAASRAATGGALSDDDSSRLSTIPHSPEFEEALREAGAHRLAVRHEGWNETLPSWARLKIYELTGRTEIKGQDPIFTVLSIIYEPSRWSRAKFLPIEHPRIAEIMGLEGKWVSPLDIVENPKFMDLQAEYDAAKLDAEEYADLIDLLRAVMQAKKLGVERDGVFESVSTRQGKPALDPSTISRAARYDNDLAGLQAREKLLGAKVKESKPFRKATEMLFHRVGLILDLPEQFTIIPDPGATDGSWIAAPRELGSRFRDQASASPAAATIENVALKSGFAGPTPLELAAADLDEAFALAFLDDDPSGLDNAIDEFLTFAAKSRAYPSDTYRNLLNFYVFSHPYKIAALLYGIAAALFGLFAFFKAAPWRIAGTTVLIVGFLVQTAAMGLRFYLSGHVPVSNMFESITFTAWAALGVGLVIELVKRQGIFGLATACAGMLALIGANMMPLHDTRLHPLRAVLNSIWLNIHVTMMLISYGVFMISAVFAAIYLIKKLAGREALFGGKPLMTLDQTEEFAYRLVQLGWPLLTVGIMLGAVWADTAWGRYWGWDPKETWALITWIVYTIYLHSRMVMGWKGWVSALACLIGFLMVMVTWLGVSYLPWFAGGLHTYASPTV
ncbi:MAG: c-type cytochrome biogenesis protein CcsB [Sumerlaeia bacterium]